jgi:hypothetical protein
MSAEGSLSGDHRLFFKNVSTMNTRCAPDHSMLPTETAFSRRPNGRARPLYIPPIAV